MFICLLYNNLRTICTINEIFRVVPFYSPYIEHYRTYIVNTLK
jgi:hypothetical protein